MNNLTPELKERLINNALDALSALGSHGRNVCPEFWERVNACDNGSDERDMFVSECMAWLD